jgi:DNA-binding winged helix-turn-helix (wHTH) protein/tetratricopeptide (TPR) repeat protein
LSAAHRLLRFGVFELSLDTQELRKSGRSIKLPPQPFRLLALLASRAGQLVTREEIQQQLWGQETYVDFEHGMNKCIQQIRTALGDNADNPLYIETLPRQGYRFVAPVVSKIIPAPLPKLIESHSGEHHVPIMVADSAGAPASVAAAVAPSYPPEERHKAAVLAPDLEVFPVRDSRAWVRRIPLAWGGASLVLVALIGGGLYWRSHKARALTEKDTIVLAEFDNKTGDAVFDRTLREGLSAQLEQSPFLNLLSDQRISETLALMAQPKDARLTSGLAREVCIRTGSAVTLDGAITMLGEDYVVGLKAVNCHNGEDVAPVEQFTVARKEKILPALGKAATQIRRKLGESPVSVQQYDVPADNVTTPSLEALQAYTLGDQKVNNSDCPAAVPLLQRAISLDTNFAMAYAKLATCYNDLGQSTPAIENVRKAHQLLDRVSAREKFAIAADYEDVATGNLDAARKNNELWAQTYPRDITPLTSLSDEYLLVGDYEKALAAFQNALKLDPGNGRLYGGLGFAYLALNRLDEAKATAEGVKARHADSPVTNLILYEVEFLRHDAAGMERNKDALMGKARWEDQILDLEAVTAAYAGRFAKARELTRRAVESAERAEEKEAAATYMAEAAVREAEVGNLAFAKQQSQAALARSTGRDVEAVCAVALTLAGDSALGIRLADDLAARFPENTIVQFDYLPAIHAAADLWRGNSAKALVALAPTAPYELNTYGSADFSLYPVYLRGEVYLAAHQGAAAAAEFQKIIDHPGVVVNEPIGALAILGRGRAYALSGDMANAQAAYRDFLALWRDADPDIPIYKLAKAEYAKLH